MQQETTLGARLRQLMTERHLKYETMGRLLDMPPQTLNRYVLGQREPKARVVMEMAARLGVDERWLMGYDVPQVREARLDEKMLPILGSIPAGPPETATEELEGWAPATVSQTDGYYYLRVKGDSMINAGIQSGDLVLIHRQNTAENGQIVACVVEGEESTLKRFRRQGDFVILQPENTKYDPRVIPALEFELGNAAILGVAEKLVRTL